MNGLASSRPVKIAAIVVVALAVVSVLIGAAYWHRIETRKVSILMHGTNEQITELLEAGADPNIRGRGRYQHGRTPLHMAAIRNDVQSMKTLLSYGANVNAPNDFNETPLYQASSRLDLDTSRILLENGADVNAKGYGSDTPLDVVLMYHHTDESKEMVALLKEYGGFTKYE